jgi:hypothetical protein
MRYEPVANYYMLSWNIRGLQKYNYNICVNMEEGECTATYLGLQCGFARHLNRQAYIFLNKFGIQSTLFFVQLSTKDIYGKGQYLLIINLSTL